jgi:hypothetical protein
MARSSGGEEVIIYISRKEKTKFQMRELIGLKTKLK